MPKPTPEEMLNYLYEKERSRQRWGIFRFFIKMLFYGAIISFGLYIYFVILPKLTPENIYKNIKTAVSETVDEKTGSIGSDISENAEDFKDNLSSKIKNIFNKDEDVEY